jgi:hypothetical protein
MSSEKLFVRLSGFLALVVIAATAAQAAEFKSIFNGKDLSDWKGKPGLWRVEDGAITGETTKEKPIEGNSFMIWQGGDIGNFELKLKYRIFVGNSGIQYRSFEVKPGSFVVGGYQADLEAGETWSGMVYGENFRGILSKRGDKTIFTKEGKPKVVEKIGDPAELQSHIKDKDWNEYHIIADGFTFTHKINGKVMTVLVDEHEKMRRAKGILALQLHPGSPMKVQFKDIQLKRTDGDAAKKNLGE